MSINSHEEIKNSENARVCVLSAYSGSRHHADAILGHHESRKGRRVINYSAHSGAIKVGSILARAASVMDDKYARKPRRGKFTQ